MRVSEAACFFIPRVFFKAALVFFFFYLECSKTACFFFVNLGGIAGDEMGVRR